MEESTELRELYLRICEAMSAGDASFFERCFSQKDGVLAIGTDPTEWWAGYDTITKVFKAQLDETGGFETVADTPHAFSDGSIGWIAGRPTLKLPDGTEIPVRLTAVLQREPDDWKILQWHFSMGIPNEDVIDEELTTQ